MLHMVSFGFRTKEEAEAELKRLEEPHKFVVQLLVDRSDVDNVLAACIIPLVAAELC